MAASAQIDKVSWRHEQIVDWMLANPAAKQSACAEFFGVTQAWLSTIIHSDAFQEYKARRYARHQQMLSESTIEKVEGLARGAVEVLYERITNEREEIPLGIVKETADMALKACGFGPKGNSNNAEVNVSINVAGAESLERAREKMRLIHSQPDATASVETQPKPPLLEHDDAPQKEEDQLPLTFE